ncbi:NAD(P)/FAD-dependent oxidoreductase [Gulosibacter sp. 10]|uniref:NAD(P)/FAD-dependent oxidoreductase n=1 Tax=Gulosibacter sp. 10 TaxID=1255570 RepID=UPI00097EE694|nr:NAD(P)/FAD-dependent oxidoreductase [Gulosibacter sp. 10]SJM61024.1 Thioredoxin reductase [Gulosibacter sp. 10]
MNSEIATPEWDAIVVGGSAAGLSAALMLGRARRRVLVLDAGSPRNRFAEHMHGVLGNEGTPPSELVRKGRDEAAQYGVRFAEGRADSVEELPRGLRVVDEAGAAHDARSLVVATGIDDELPEIPGLAERWGESVLHCPYCHGWEVADGRLGVLATSPAALHQASMVRQWSERVVLFSAALGDLDPAFEARLRSRGVEIVPDPVEALLGEDRALRAVRVAGGREIEVDAVFTAGVPRPHDGFLERLGLDRAELPFGMGSFLGVDPMGRTSHARVWAAGNVVNPMANVPMVIGAGASAGAAANGFLVEEDFDLAQEAGRG